MIPLSLLISRRIHLAEKMSHGSLLILLSSEQLLRNGDVEYPFRQGSGFWYLTGFTEANAALVVRKNIDGTVDEILYVRPSSKETEIWVGLLAGVDGAREISDIQDVRLWPDLETDLGILLRGLACCYFQVDGYSFREMRSRIASLAHEQSLQLSDPAVLIRELRLIKDSWEIEQLQIANTVAVGAHRNAIANLAQRLNKGELVYEYQVEADIYHAFGSHGLTWSYPAIVASGKNACILHYTKNNQVVEPGELLLIDAGCEVFGYASDITRSYPVSGRFSSAQKEVYEIVLAAQLKAIDEIARPGATLQSFHHVCVEAITEGLLALGILKGSLEENVVQQKYRKYFMHGTGHFLGLDVHDVGNYTDAHGKRADIPLTSGMVATVEPGIYISPDDVAVAEEFRGIGIRIEDDIVKTDVGVLNLTGDMPKTVAAVEALCLGSV